LKGFRPDGGFMTHVELAKLVEGAEIFSDLGGRRFEVELHVTELKLDAGEAAEAQITALSSAWRPA
jgi:hypothetical protein